MNWIDIEQNTPDWLNCRLGLFTSSNIYNLFVKGKGGKVSKSAETYITQKAIEHIYPIQVESFGSKAMQWGNDNEDNARNVYEVITGNVVTNGGFYIFDENTGSSPDGLVGTDGMIEIKCPYTRINHLNNVLNLKDDTDLFKYSKQYYYQVHHQMFCSGRKWVDFCSFDPRLLDSKGFLHTIRIERNEELMSQMAELIFFAGKERDRIIQEFKNI
tara:strand:- start:238 stop:882 length:645 start_codon:yes stop_codon:yes gene_type:complete